MRPEIPETVEPVDAAPGGLTARAAGLDLVDAILNKKQELDAALDASGAFAELPIRDRAFCRMMVATLLRRLGQIEDLIRRAEDNPGAMQSPRLRHILQLGVTQIVFMDVPDHAAVDTSVRLAEAEGFSRQKGYVNGVLRTVAREGKDWLSRQDEARLNIPHWLMEQWILDHGLRAAAETAMASLAEAPLDITVKNPGMAAYWEKELEAAILPTGSLRRNSGGRVSELPGYIDGMWWVQDAAAALPVKLFGKVNGQTVVDLCAAPGGKTAQLAAQGAKVIAVDRSVQRIRRLTENLTRLRLEKNVQIETADASVWRPREPVPFVLLDAPCTATGTIRRNPDILHHKAPRDMERLARLQEEMLNNAAGMLMPSGVLVYCTCSLQKEEGERQIDRLLRDNPDLTRLPVRPEEIGGIEGAITEDGDLRLFPFLLAAHGGVDGFYAARVVKAG